MGLCCLGCRYQPSFHGVDLSALRGAAVDEYFRQPIVVCGTHIHKFLHLLMETLHTANDQECWSACAAEKQLYFIKNVFATGFVVLSSDLSPQDTFDIRILMAKSVKHTVNFLETKEEDLYRYVCVFVCMQMLVSTCCKYLIYASYPV